MPRRTRSREEAADARLGGLTERALAQLVPPKIYARGVAYLEDGAIVDAGWRGDELHADVQGSEIDPYHVVATARGDRVIARCDCPYGEEWGAWCKHVVATLLLALRDGATLPQRPPAADLVAALDRDALARLVVAWVAEWPALYDALAEAAAPNAKRPPDAARRAARRPTT